MFDFKSQLFYLIRYGIVGTIATGIQYGFYIIFVDVLSLMPVISTIFSYCVSLVVNFFLSTYFTFKTKPSPKKGLFFLISHLINMGLQVGLVALFVPIIGKTLAILPAFAVCIPLNYLMVKISLTSNYFDKYVMLLRSRCKLLQ